MSQQSLPFDEPPTDSQLVLPVHDNLIETSANIVLQQLGEQLPDLSRVHVILDSNSGVNQFRSVLLNKAAELGFNALLGPNITTLENWARQHSNVQPAVLSEHTRELLLVGALKEFPSIYKQSNPWTLAESLMELFDELTLANLELPKDLEEFKQQISDAYGATEDIKATLGKEALLVHSLWYAMHQQLAELQCLDRTSAAILQLANSTEQLNSDEQVFYAGIENSTPAKKIWQQKLLKQNQLTVVTHNYKQCTSNKPDNNYYRFLDLAYDTSSANFYQRIDSCKQQFDASPVLPHIRIFAAETSEDEALGIDIQIRRWLLEGKNRIGIVTDNRKLARRVRALLDRANIKVDDDAGWALSTTSAATVLERWLETIEQDFHYLPLLDFLKSPFVLSNDEEFLKTVYQLEQHIVIDENTANDINRYLKHIDLRKNRLEKEHIKVNYDSMVALLHTLHAAAKPLLELQRNNQQHDSGQFIDALLESLSALKIIDTFSQDAAGVQLLSEINELVLAAKQIPTQMNWVTFRAWLGRTFERFNFKPQTSASAVILTTLSNSAYLQFDACVIAGAEQNFLPHAGKVSPFFNDAVRAALDITTRAERQSLHYFLYRRLLCSIKQDGKQQPNLLITRRAVEKGEEIIASPWVEALQAFHQQCYGTDLSDSEIPQLITDSRCQVVLDDAVPPSETTGYPKPCIPEKLIPESLSASTYQQLVDCPYQFFAARCLNLAPTEVVKEALAKQDYGNLVHRCLEAFHSNVKDLPGPFKEKISDSNRDQAIAVLNEISEAIFHTDVEDNFLHRGWLNRWQKLIPLYIDWQMQQQNKSTPIGNEIVIDDVPLTDSISIRGKIDRVDQQADGLVILDYKTGRSRSKDEIIDGEAVQLPFYLLLLMTEKDPHFARFLGEGNDRVSAFYVDLYNNRKVSSKALVENQELIDAVENNKHRLIAVMDQLRQGYEAPAWGSVDVCKFCKMDVLCRKQLWSVE